MNISWDATGYEKNFSFVPAFGAAAMDLIDAGDGARCLDLGCGNGTLTAELAARGLDVVGMDASPEMIELARATHPELRFVLGTPRPSRLTHLSTWSSRTRCSTG